MNDQTIIAVASILGAALVMGLGALGAAAGESRLGAAGMDAIARQPDESANLTRNMLVGLAMIESTAIFALVIALVLLFANPFVTT